VKILIIAPHMDDEVLGMGATIARRVGEGDEVHVCCVAHRVYDHVFDEHKTVSSDNVRNKRKAFWGTKDCIVSTCRTSALTPVCKTSLFRWRTV